MFCVCHAHFGAQMEPYSPSHIVQITSIGVKSVIFTVRVLIEFSCFKRNTIHDARYALGIDKRCKNWSLSSHILRLIRVGGAKLIVHSIYYKMKSSIDTPLKNGKEITIWTICEHLHQTLMIGQRRVLLYLSCTIKSRFYIIIRFANYLSES